MRCTSSKTRPRSGPSTISTRERWSSIPSSRSICSTCQVIRRRMSRLSASQIEGRTPAQGSSGRASPTGSGSDFPTAGAPPCSRDASPSRLGPSDTPASRSDKWRPRRCGRDRSRSCRPRGRQQATPASSSVRAPAQPCSGRCRCRSPRRLSLRRRQAFAPSRKQVQESARSRNQDVPEATQPPHWCPRRTQCRRASPALCKGAKAREPSVPSAHAACHLRGVCRWGFRFRDLSAAPAMAVRSLGPPTDDGSSFQDRSLVVRRA
jgi:hypothetical protein